MYQHRAGGAGTSSTSLVRSTLSGGVGSANAWARLCAVGSGRPMGHAAPMPDAADRAASRVRSHPRMIPRSISALMPGWQLAQSDCSLPSQNLRSSPWCGSTSKPRSAQKARRPMLGRLATSNARPLDRGAEAILGSPYAHARTPASVRTGKRSTPQAISIRRSAARSAPAAARRQC